MYFLCFTTTEDLPLIKGIARHTRLAPHALLIFASGSYA